MLKISVAVILGILAVQIRGSPNEPVPPDYGMNAQVQLAMKYLTRYYNQAKGEIQRSKDIINEFSPDVENSEDIFKMITEYAEASAEHINHHADQLIEQGKRESKPPSYFECVKKHRSDALDEIKMQREVCRLLMQPLQEETMKKFRNVLRMLELMDTSTDFLFKEHITRLQSCQDAECIEAVLKEAWREYGFVRGVVKEFMIDLMKTYMFFKDEAYNVLLSVASRIESVVARGKENMRLC